MVEHFYKKRVWSWPGWLGRSQVTLTRTRITLIPSKSKEFTTRVQKPKMTTEKITQRPELKIVNSVQNFEVFRKFRLVVRYQRWQWDSSFGGSQINRWLLTDFGIIMARFFKIRGPFFMETDILEFSCNLRIPSKIPGCWSHKFKIPGFSRIGVFRGFSSHCHLSSISVIYAKTYRLISY